MCALVRVRETQGVGESGSERQKQPIFERDRKGTESERHKKRERESEDCGGGGLRPGWVVGGRTLLEGTLPLGPSLINPHPVLSRPPGGSSGSPRQVPGTAGRGLLDRSLRESLTDLPLRWH